MANLLNLDNHPAADTLVYQVETASRLAAPDDRRGQLAYQVGSFEQRYRNLRSDHATLIERHKAAIDRLAAAERMLEAHGIEI